MKQAKQKHRRYMRRVKGVFRYTVYYIPKQGYGY